MTEEKKAVIRKALYGLLPIVGSVLTAFGVVSADKWQVIAGLVTNVIGLVIAFIHTSPSDHAELAGLRADATLRDTSAAVQDSLAEAINTVVGSTTIGVAPSYSQDVNNQGSPNPPEPQVVNPQGKPVYQTGQSS